MASRTIKSVFEEHKKSLLAIAGVVGVAIGKSDGRPCIRVLVSRKDSKIPRQIPDRLEGYVVTVDKTGEIHALDAERH